MPLTSSHPAAVLPLRRWFRAPGALAALVVGSVAPDLIHFIPLGVPREEAHSKLGLFWFSLPMGFLAYAVWHALLKRPVLFLLPGPVRRRIRPELSLFPSLDSARGTITIGAALLVGALSHIVWDAFTHETGFAVRNVPLLETRLAALGLTLPAYAALQHLSTLVGGLVILGWAARRLAPRAPVEPGLSEPFSPSLRVPLGLLVAAVGVAGGLVPAMLFTAGPRVSTREFAYLVYVEGLTGCAVALAGIGVAWWLLARDRGRRRPAAGEAGEGGGAGAGGADGPAGRADPRNAPGRPTV